MPLIRLAIALSYLAFAAIPAHCQESPLKDANGDPLPPGAIGRIGAQRFRASDVVYGARFVDGGKKLLVRVGNRPGALQIFEMEGGKELARMPLEPKNFSLWCISPDARLVASIPNRGVVEVRELATGKVVFKFENPELDFTLVQFSPDGRRLATLANIWDEAAKKVQRHSVAVYMWDILKLKAARTFLPPTKVKDTFRADWLTFSPDGAYIAATASEAGKTGVIRVWDVDGKRESWKLPGQTERFYQARPIAISANSKTLAAVHDGKLVLFDLAARKQTKEVAVYVDPCATLDFSPDGKLLIACTAEDAKNPNQVRMWQVSTGQEIALPKRIIEGHVFSDDGTTLALADFIESKIIICAADTGQIQSKIDFSLRAASRATLEQIQQMASQGMGRLFALSPDGKTLVGCNRAGQVQRFEISSGKEIPPPGVATDVAQALVFAPDGKKLLAAGLGRVLLHDLQGKLPPLQLRIQPSAGESANGTKMPIATCLAFSHDGCRAAAGWSDGAVAVWEVATAKLLWQAHEHKSEIYSVAFTSDDYSLVSTGANDSQVTWWNVKDGLRQRKLVLDRHADGIPQGQFVLGPNAQMALYSSGNGPWQEFELASGKFRREIKIRDHSLGDGSFTGLSDPFAFSPDGQFLLAAGYGAFRLLNLSLSEELRCFAFADGPIASYYQNRARFSPDCQTIVGIAGKDVRCWDRDTGTLLATLGGHDGGAFAVAFAPNGRNLATSAGDGTILLWPAPPGLNSSPAIEPVSPAPSASVSRTDADGESLPPGAKTRLGLLRFQHGADITALRYSADGKSILVQTANPGEFNETWIDLALWDAATGKLTNQIEVTHVSILPRRNEDHFDHWTISEDARFLAMSGTYKGRKQTGLTPMLCIKEISSGKTIFQLDDPEKRTMAVRFAPDGNTILDLHRLTLMDRRTGRDRQLQRGDNGGFPREAVFSPDGNHLLVVNRFGTIDSWSLERNGSHVRLPLQVFKTATQLVIAPGGKQFAMLVSGGKDKPPRMVLVEIHSGKIIRDFGEQAQTPGKVLFSPDGNLLVATAQNQQAHWEWKNEMQVWEPSREVLRRWEVATGKELPPIETTNGLIAEFTPDGKILAIATDRQLHLVDPISGRRLHSLPFDADVSDNSQQFGFGLITPWKVLPAFGGPFAFSPDGKTVAVAARRTIRQFDVATGTELGPKPNWQTIFSVATAKNGKWIASCAPGEVQVWNGVTNEIAFNILPWSTREGRAVIFTALALTGDGRSLAVGGSDGKVALYDVFSAKRTRYIRCHDWPVTSLVFLPDAKTLASSDVNGNVALWEVASGRLVRKQESPGASDITKRGQVTEDSHGPAYLLEPGSIIRFWHWPALTPDGSILTSLDEAGIRLFEPAGPKVHVVANPLYRPIITASHDSKFLVLTEGYPRWNFYQYDALASLLDFENNKKIRAFASFGPTTAYRFSPNGNLLAASGKDGLRIWDVATGTILADFHGHRGPATAIAFSPDGSTLVSAGFDGTLLVWDVAALLVRPATKELAESELPSLWEQLAGQDAAAAGLAMRRLTAHPKQVIALFREKLKPATSAPKELIAKLVTDLDSAQPKVRANATTALQKMAETAEPALRACLASNPTLEQKMRADHLLARLGEPLADGDKLRALRAVELLELVGSPEAAEILKLLAAGADGAYVTRDARAALKRMENIKASK